jgi:hypothetical protein
MEVLMKTLQLFAALISSVLLSGNAIAALSPKDSAGLKRIYIAPIELPKKPLIITSGAGTAWMIAGPLGIAVANGTSDLPKAYLETLAQNKIDVAAYLSFELMDRLSARGFEIVDTSDQADAVLDVAVGSYGLTGGIFSRERFPMLAARFTLTNKSGKHIWRENRSTNVLKEVLEQVKTYPIPEYFNDPKLLDSQIRKVNAIVVVSVVSTL